MSDPLRDRRLLTELAAKQQVIEISEKIGSFNSLVRVVEQDLAALDATEVSADWRDLPLTGRLEFGFNAAQDGVPTLLAALSATVAAVCQRCLEPFELQLEAMLRLQFCKPGDEVDAGDEYELWELAGDSLSPIEIVEEALLMAMPLAAMHPTECVDIEAPAGGEEMTTPFASLRRQMDQGTSD